MSEEVDPNMKEFMEQALASKVQMSEAIKKLQEDIDRLRDQMKPKGK